MDPKLEEYLNTLPEDKRQAVRDALRGLVEVEPTDPTIAAARLAAGLPPVAPKSDPTRKAAGLEE